MIVNRIKAHPRTFKHCTAVVVKTIPTQTKAYDRNESRRATRDTALHPNQRGPVSACRVVGNSPEATELVALARENTTRKNVNNPTLLQRERGKYLNFFFHRSFGARYTFKKGLKIAHVCLLLIRLGRPLIIIIEFAFAIVRMPQYTQTNVVI